MLAMSGYFAIKEATPSTANYKKVLVITVPATFEKILMSIKKLKNIV